MISLFISAVLSGNIKAQSGDFSNYQWSAIAATGEPVARHENAFVEFEGKFYLMGGRGIKPVNVFDPSTNEWEQKANTPIEFHHFQPVVYQKAIYIVSALTGPYPTEVPISHVWIYHPARDVWEKGSEIPAAFQRGGAGAVLRSNRIYVVCGITYGHTSGTTNAMSYYDLGNSKWTALTKAPHVRDHFTAVIVENQLYCIGGRNTSVHHPADFTAFFGATVSDIDVYDFDANKWVTLKEKLPIATAGAGVVSRGDYIFYIGGESAQDTAHSETQVFDVKTRQWRTWSPLVVGRHGSQAVQYQRKIYLAAGSPKRGGGNMNSIEVFELKK
ncbi:galactose oxidase [Reichenbachiella carrageenanivorans]|uniref:Galactose oxidase n=1 Tax=Reichenbachiella carrageenanivorans TaxID=2979869 RepID=A0ABY6CYT0_9BACT|nr:kelch repeat-containing protein [Reichenbachiella carrageenanivorans]UXX79067.1 galactose oxidase [Reichenbachiella carrageenanivorans]